MWCTHWYWTTQNPTGLACVILVVGCEMPQCVNCLGWVITRSQWRNSPTRAVPVHCHEVQHLTRKWARARGGTHPRKQWHCTATKFNSTWYTWPENEQEPVGELTHESSATALPQNSTFAQVPYLTVPNHTELHRLLWAMVLNHTKSNNNFTTFC